LGLDLGEVHGVLGVRRNRRGTRCRGRSCDSSWTRPSGPCIPNEPLPVLKLASPEEIVAAAPKWPGEVGVGPP
jgi:hypothetical protein